MRLFSKLECSSANGPGNRAVIWFAGCNLNCRDCWNPGTHSFSVPDTEITAIENWLLTLSGIDGVTFSGGEPLQSLPDLLRLCRFIRAKRPELSLGMFSGYSTQELSTGRFEYFQDGAFIPGSAKDWNAVRSLLDFAVCGRYNALQNTSNKPLCGSANQSIELFSSRYTEQDFTEQIAEITISDSGLIQITGFPGLEFLNSIRST